MKNYDNLYNKMLQRRSGTDTILEFSNTYREKFSTASGKTTKYVLGAMTEVSQEYTEATYKEAHRVINHLKRELSDVRFDFQGSVTNNTHIKGYSDIDILIVTKKYIDYESPAFQSNRYNSPYRGNHIQDLIDIRHNSTKIIEKNFPTVFINKDKPKCIALSGGSLKRDIDLVPSCDWETHEYQRTNFEYHKGIRILDYHKKEKIGNKPFYHNELLRRKDLETNGYYKKAVRLLKNIKEDSDTTIKFSSYDIAAVLYHMGSVDLNVGNIPLLLVERIYNYMNILILNEVKLKALKVPDESRSIIQKDEDIKALRLLTLEVKDIYEDLKNERIQLRESIYSYSYAF